MTYAEGIQKGRNSIASIAVAETKFLLDLHNSISGQNYLALLAVNCPSPATATAPKFPGIAPLIHGLISPTKKEKAQLRPGDSSFLPPLRLSPAFRTYVIRGSVSCVAVGRHGDEEADEEEEVQDFYGRKEEEARTSGAEKALSGGNISKTHQPRIEVQTAGFHPFFRFKCSLGFLP